MPYSILNKIREFSPKEAAAVSGVSASLQRDWRRREILPEDRKEGWASFTLEDVIQMTVMKAFSDSAISVQVAREYSESAVLPTLQFIAEMPEAVEFEGDELPEKIKKLSTERFAVGGKGRWLFAPLPPNNKDEFGQLTRTNNANTIIDTMEENNSFHGVIIDHELLALRIAERAGLPLIRCFVEYKEENE